MIIQVCDHLGGGAPGPDEVESLMELLLQVLDRTEGELSVALVDDETIRELNHRYRGLDRPTDVLSFDLSEETDQGLQGEIVLSLETARRRAKGNPDRLAREVELLLGHSLLHLLGHDHSTPEQKEQMQRAQRSLLDRARRRFRRNPWMKTEQGG